MSIKSEREKEILHDLGARFLSLNGNKSSLLTVTSVGLSSDKKRATIFFTVFPANPIRSESDAQLTEGEFREKMEKTALEFAKRKRSEFKEFVRENSSLGIIPQFDFEIDLGEKNRQKIDGLLNE